MRFFPGRNIMGRQANERIKQRSDASWTNADASRKRRPNSRIRATSITTNMMLAGNLPGKNPPAHAIRTRALSGYQIPAKIIRRMLPEENVPTRRKIQSAAPIIAKIPGEFRWKIRIKAMNPMQIRIGRISENRHSANPMLSMERKQK